MPSTATPQGKWNSAWLLAPSVLPAIPASSHGGNNAACRDDLANGVVVGVGHEEIVGGIQGQSLRSMESCGRANGVCGATRSRHACNSADHAGGRDFTDSVIQSVRDK